jgi:small-conductance mechanosensitive channel
VIDWTQLSKDLEQLAARFEAEFLTYSALVQLAVLAAAFAVASIAGRRLRRWLSARAGGDWFAEAVRALAARLVPIAMPLVWAILVWIAVGVAERAKWPFALMNVVASLLTAWVVIRFLSQFVIRGFWSAVFAAVVWTIAALNIVGLLAPTMATLEAMTIRVGDFRINLLGVVKGAILIAVLAWIVMVVSSVVERRLQTAAHFSDSARVLVSKLFRLALIVVVFLVGLDTLGVDLSTLAVLGGAVGVGLGFGLQKIVANFVSGLIILLDKSIKPGDVISVGNTFGWIVRLRARYVAVRTRDGTEILIPNETLVTEKVENWSFTDRLLRLHAPVGISYHSDLDKARALCIEAAAEVPRVQTSPKPVCLIKGFGNSSVDLELRFWITDPQEGRVNVISDVYAKVWHKFHANGIEIPFPQRDLHLKSPDVIRVRTEPAETGKATGRRRSRGAPQGGS